MEKLHDYYKFQLNELLKHTMKTYDAQLHIITDIFLINKNEITDGDFQLYFQGDKMIIELKNKYSYEQILAILSSIFSTGYIVAQYFISTDTLKNNLVLDDTEFLKYWKTPKYKKYSKYIKNITDIRMICEPKWNNTVKMASNIYHITTHNRTEDILKSGILPKSGKKRGYHPERIYFSKNIKDVSQVLKEMMITNKINGGKIESYDLLEIDTNNLKSIGFDKKQYDIVFYEDPNSSGIYTYDRIPPENIKLIEEDLK